MRAAWPEGLPNARLPESSEFEQHGKVPFKGVRLVSALHRCTWSDHMSTLVAFLKDETGATAIEYGLIAAGISVVIIASVNAIGSSLNSTFQLISDTLN